MVMETQKKEDNEPGGRIVALLVLGVMGTSALGAAWFILSPNKQIFPHGHSPESIFTESRSSDQLRDRLYNKQDSRQERDSTLLAPPAIPEDGETGKKDKAPPPKRAPSTSERGGSTWKIMKKAENYFFAAKKSKRFKKAKGIQAFRKDFLADPELAAINERYYKKHRNAVRFMVETIKSPAFRKVAKKHITNGDISSFVNKMMGSGSVVKAAKVVSKEFNLKPYIDALPIPGLGSLGSITGKAKGLKSVPNDKATMEMMNLDPDMLNVEKMVEKAKKGKR